jgi:hypothetical protein
MKKNIPAVLFLTAITIIFFSPILFTENTFVFRDIYRYYYPFYHLKVGLIKDGIFPFWNPYLFSGTPLFALIQLGIFYPPSILLYLLPFEIGIKIFIIIHVLLSGFFMYCLGKTLNLETKASLAASITFMFSSFSLCMIAHPNILCSITWLPIIFSIYQTALSKRSLLFTIISGICLSIQILSGEPVIAYMTIWALLLYGICFSYDQCGYKYAITSFMIILLVGIGLSLIQLLPFFELAFFSPRAHGVVYQEATDWSLHQGELLNLIIPFFSDIMKLSRQGLLISIYMGIIPLSMILLSIFNRERRKWFWIGLFVLSLILSLGSHLFLYPLCYQYLPGFNMIRHAVKFIALVVFCGAVLTGYGFNSISKLRKEFFYILLVLLMVCICFWGIGIIRQGIPFWGLIIEGQRYLPIIPIILIVISLGISFRKKTANISTILLLIIIADLFFYGINLTPLISQKFYNQKPIIAKELEKESALYRFILTPATEASYVHVKGRDLAELTCWQSKSVLLSNLGLLWRIPDAYGYEAMTIRDYEKFIWHVRNVEISSIYHLLCMLNVKYIASKTPLLHDGLKLMDVIRESLLTEKWGSTYTSRDAKPCVPTRHIYLYKNTGCLSRAFFVPKATVVTNKKEAFYYIMRPEFNPTKEVIIYEKTAHLLKLQTCESNQVKIDTYQPNRVVIQAKTNTSGFLFMGDTYYPGWKAFIDGKETKIYRANYIFRAIEVTPGAHKIEFIYYPQVFKIGMLGSICTVFLIGIVCLSKFKTWMFTNWRKSYQNKGNN